MIIVYCKDLNENIEKIKFDKFRIDSSRIKIFYLKLLFNKSTSINMTVFILQRNKLFVIDVYFISRLKL